MIPEEDKKALKAEAKAAKAREKAEAKAAKAREKAAAKAEKEAAKKGMPAEVRNKKTAILFEVLLEEFQKKLAAAVEEYPKKLQEYQKLLDEAVEAGKPSNELPIEPGNPLEGLARKSGNAGRLNALLKELSKITYVNPEDFKESVEKQLKDPSRLLTFNDIISLFKKASESYAFGDAPGVLGLDASGIKADLRMTFSEAIKIVSSHTHSTEKEIKMNDEKFAKHTARSYVEALVAASESNPEAKAILMYLDLNVSILNVDKQLTLMNLNNIVTCAQKSAYSMGFLTSAMSPDEILINTPLATECLKYILLARQTQLKNQNKLGASTDDPNILYAAIGGTVGGGLFSESSDSGVALEEPDSAPADSGLLYTQLHESMGGAAASAADPANHDDEAHLYEPVERRNKPAPEGQGDAPAVVFSRHDRTRQATRRGKAQGPKVAPYKGDASPATPPPIPPKRRGPGSSEA